MYGGEYVVARQHMPELRRTTLKLFLELLPKELLIEYRVADAEVHVRSATGKPAVFYFVGLEEPQKLDSLTLSGAGIDEAAQTSEEAFLKLQGRVRSPLGLRKIIAVGNPRGHDHFFRYFIKQDMFDSPDKKAQYKMIIAPTTENKHLPDGYVESMMASYSKERIQRDIMGSFDSFEGQIISEFNRQVHVVPYQVIPKEWKRFIGGDHGYRNAAAFIFCAVDHDDNIWVYDEFYRREWLIEEICKGKKSGGKGIVDMIGKDKIEGVWIDPSTKRRNGQTGESDYDIYVDNLPKSLPLIPANNEVEAGLDQLKSYFKVDQKTGKGRIFILDHCTHLIDEIVTYRYDELSASQVGQKSEKETPRKVDDHAVDALRYAVMSRQMAPKRKKADKGKEWETPSNRIQAELEQLRNPKVKDAFGFGDL